MKYRELYDYGVSMLTQEQLAEASLDARLLLEYVCHTNQTTLLAHGDREVDAKEEENYKALLEKRRKHIPLQHLTGEQMFMGLRFVVNEHVLVPRQDTEILVEEAMRELHDGMSVLDMCTGSGCILLSLLQYSNDCRGVGVDISPKALLVAQENAKLLGIAAEFREGNLFSALMPQEKFDLLISNPPYIESEVIPTLMEEVRCHEPQGALDGGSDGLDFYRRISLEAKPYLYRGARIFLEIGCNQAEAVSGILEKEGYQDIEVVKDFAGLDRVVKCSFRG